MDGKQGGTVDKIADNAWLKMIERLAVPLIGLIVWQMYTDIASVRENMPVVIERVKNLEVRADKVEVRMNEGRTSRDIQYNSMSNELAALKVQVAGLDQSLKDINATMRDINSKIAVVRDRP